MADRSVTVKLDANVKPFLKAMAEAEAAAKRFRDGLGKGMPDPFEPYDEEQKKRRKQAPKDGEQIAGAFARSFARHLESAFRSLPKAKIDGDSTAAQKKISEVRSSLQALSDKEIGVDIDVAAAMGQVATLQMELERLSDTADIDVRADTMAALAQLQAIQREVEKLNRDQPTVRPDVDGSQAQAQLADLQRRLDELSSRRIGIDLDAGAARSELSSIQRDLERLNATSADPKIRLDSAQALAQLRAVQSDLGRLDGRTANVRVNADVGAALAALAAVSAAVAGIPAVATIGVGVAGLGAAFGAAAAGAAAFGAVAIPSLGRVNEALQQAETSAGGAGGAMKSAAQKAAEAAASALRLAEAQDRVADAAARIKDAQQAVRDAVQGVAEAKRDATRAAEDAAARQAQAAARIADAERSVQDAHRATQRAIEDLTRARERAQERMEDLALATEGGALSEERALLSIKRAQADLAKVNADPRASAYDREDAALRLKEAEFNLKRIREANGDLAKEQAEANRKGVEGSDEVVAAKERILDAQRREADAQRALTDAHAEAARAAREGADQVADANERVADAQRKVADAQKDVVKAQRDHLRAMQALKVEQLQQKAAMEQTGGAAGGAATKMAQLSKAEQQLAKDIKAFKDAYIAWQRELQPDVFPVIRSGMALLQTLWKTSTPLVKASAKGLDEFLKKANSELKTDEWQDFFDALTEHAPKAIDAFGDSTLNIAEGVAGIVEALLPQADKLLAKVEDITADFAKWGQGLKTSPEFEKFIDYVETNGPKVGEILGNLAEFVGKILGAGADVAPAALDFLVGLSETLAGMSPEQVQAIATGVGLIFAAAKIGTTLKLGAFLLLAEVLAGMDPDHIRALAVAIGLTIAAVKGYQAVTGIADAFRSLSGGIDASGKSADGAKGKLANLGSVLKAGGIVGIAVAAGGAFDAMTDSLQGLNPKIDDLADSMATFARDGKETPILIDQLDDKFSNFGSSLVGLAANGFKPFENFGDSARRLVSDDPFTKVANSLSGVVDSAGLVTLDNGAKAIQDLDSSLATMVGRGQGQEAAMMFDSLAKRAAEAGVPMDKLKQLFPEYADSLTGAIPKTAEMAGAMHTLGVEVDPTAAAMERFNTGLDIFNAKTDVAERTLELKAAFDEAKTAIDKAGGSFSTTGDMADKQKRAVIEAREQFGGYIEKVLGAAKAAGEMAGKTGEAAIKSDEAREAVLRQLEPLFQLAGKSAEAKEQIYKMAEGFGINRTQADKAKTGVDGVNDVIKDLKGKKVDVGVDTSQGMDALTKLKIAIATLAAQNIKLTLNAILEKNKAAGGIERYAAGGIRMAAGGVRPQPPALVSKPTILFGEGSHGQGATEAFIPYESQYRPRAVQLLGQVAQDFGLELYNAQAGKRIDSLSGGIKEAQQGISAGLTSATAALTATLGSSGSLTGSIDQVGVVGEAMTAGWVEGSQQLGTAVTGMGETVGGSIDTLSTVITDFQAVWENAVASIPITPDDGKAGKVGGSQPKSKGKGKSGKTSIGASATETRGKLPQGGLIAGDPGPSMVWSGGMTTASTASLPVNSSRVSSPQVASGAAVRPSSSSSGSGSASAGPAVLIQEQNIYQDADADRFAAQTAIRVYARGR